MSAIDEPAVEIEDAGAVVRELQRQIDELREIALSPYLPCGEIEADLAKRWKGVGCSVGKSSSPHRWTLVVALVTPLSDKPAIVMVEGFYCPSRRTPVFKLRDVLIRMKPWEKDLKAAAPKDDAIM